MDYRCKLEDLPFLQSTHTVHDGYSFFVVLLSFSKESDYCIDHNISHVIREYSMTQCVDYQDQSLNPLPTFSES